MENLAKQSGPNKLGIRHVQALLLFFAITLMYAGRTCMSVAIVAMRNKKSANPDFPEYDWNSQISGIILSSFFWGYVAMQIPSGYVLSKQISPRMCLMGGAFLSSIFTMCIPFLANYGYIPVICCRIFSGICQGCLMPCVYIIISRWVPPAERARLGSLILSGQPCSSIITMPISGLLTTSSFGWPSIFYFFGALGIIWCIIYYFLSADCPADHPRISQNELKYINDSLSILNKMDAHTEKPKTPWKAMLSSIPVFALTAAHSGHNWGFYTLLTETPTYMKSILGFDSSKSGIVFALPYLASFLMSIPISFLADFAISKGVSTVVSRKVCTTIGLWIPAIAFIVLAVIVTDNAVVIISILVIAVGFNCGVASGFHLNHIDLSPIFAGPLMSITNFVANFVGLIAPLVVGAIVTDESNVSQWKIIFFIAAGFFFFSNLIFLIFGKATNQWWNYPEGRFVQTSRPSIISIEYDPTMVAFPLEIAEKEEIPPC